jgi:hypothetical protein
VGHEEAIAGKTVVRNPLPRPGGDSTPAIPAFQRYRKYESNSNITLEDGRVKPGKAPNVIK